MNKIIILLSIMLFAISSNAQNLRESDVPLSVKNKFNTMHPEVKNVRWERDNGRYEAEFGASNLETSVYFDMNGNHLKTENEIAVSLLPGKVNDYVTANLPGKKIREAEKITDVNGNISYEAEIGNSDYYFDSAGNFLRKDSDDSDEDDSDDDDDNDRGNDRNRDRNRGRDKDNDRDSDDD